MNIPILNWAETGPARFINHPELCRCCVGKSFQTGSAVPWPGFKSRTFDIYSAGVIKSLELFYLKFYLMPSILLSMKYIFLYFTQPTAVV